jgi:hypothetical protein
MTPEHLHVMLTHLPMAGLPLAALVLAAGWIMRNRAVIVTGLALGALAAVSGPLLMATGEGAEERMDGGALGAAVDAAGRQWLDEHEEAAEIAVVTLYVALGVCAAGLVVAGRWPNWRRAAAGAGLCAVLLGTGGAVFAAMSGGRINHPEFRPGGATAAPAGGAADND